MRHALFGDLHYDPDDEAWTGVAHLPRFASFGEDRDEPGARPDGMLPLVVRDASKAGPSAPQAAAYRYLLDHEADVFRAALDALFDSYQQYTASPLSGFWSWLARRLGVTPIESPDGLAGVARFTELEVTAEHRAGSAYLVFAVHCDWEPEHGMLVVCRPDAPATWTTADALELLSDGEP